MPGKKSKKSDELPVKAESGLCPTGWSLFQDAAEISAENQEILVRLASVIKMAKSFRLGFVKCNQPVQSRQLFARLKDMLAGEANIVRVDLLGPVESLRRAVLQELERSAADDQGKRAVLVFGFEQSIPSVGAAPALDELNQSRDNFPKSFSGPLLIWLPDYALTRLARGAPDFWGWRSSVFEFVPEAGIVSAVERMALRDEMVSNLSREEKMVRAEALEGLVRDYLEMKRGEREDRALAEVLRRLGEIRTDLYNYSQAIQLFSQSLEISRNTRDKKGVADSLAGLGRINIFLADYPRAIDYYEQALAIVRDIPDWWGEGNALNNMGNAYAALGDARKAIDYYEQALITAREIGERRDEGNALGNLGIAYAALGDARKAIDYYEQRLVIAREIGDRRGEGAALGNLGTAFYRLDDIDKAQDCYQQQLKIAQEIGDRNGEAHALWGQAICLQKKNDPEQAIAKTESALRIFEQIESPSASTMRELLAEWKK
jgi:G-protein signaling modulator 2